MTQMTQLDLTHVDCVDDEVLRTIAVSMPQLQQLDLRDCSGSLSAFEYLLPSEDLGRRGCPDLQILNFRRYDDITIKLLKNILFCLPKLRILGHKLMVDVLAEVTDEELGLKSGRCLEILTVNTHVMGCSILQNAPIFALDCNITQVDITITLSSNKAVLDLLMPFQNLKSISILGMEKSCEGIMSVLESKGHRLETLHLKEVHTCVTPCDIIRTCPMVEELTLNYVYYKGNSESEADHEYQKNLHEDGSVLPYLKNLTLMNVSKELCSSDTLISLLLGPQLEKICLGNVQAMSNDVMFRVLSCSSASLSKVKSFTLDRCPVVTAAPFVQWLNKEKIMLEDLHIKFCGIDGEDVLHAAVEKYPQPLNVIVISDTY